ncbi:MAG: hypothetical protein AB7T22_02830 [Calditrichaceae bacterium]
MKRLLLFYILSLSPVIGQDFSVFNIKRQPMGGDSTQFSSPLGLKYSFKNMKSVPFIQDTFYIKLDYETADDRTLYYSPENIIPANPLFLDTRSSSYYTPRIVSDRMDQIMNRPRADSFVPLPVAAVLAARLAAKYIDIGKKIEISARDYIIENEHILILNALWKNPGCSAADIYSDSLFKYQGTLNTLESSIGALQNKKLVKVRKVENENDRYYAAQSKQVVINLIENGMQSPDLTQAEKNSLYQFLKIIRDES